jgi:hypothetical protein
MTGRAKCSVRTARVCWWCCRQRRGERGLVSPERAQPRVATFIQDGWEHSCAGMCSQDEHEQQHEHARAGRDEPSCALVPR